MTLIEMLLPFQALLGLGNRVGCFCRSRGLSMKLLRVPRLSHLVSSCVPTLCQLPVGRGCEHVPTLDIFILYVHSMSILGHPHPLE
jgi:hypothetical protein